MINKKALLESIINEFQKSIDATKKLLEVTHATINDAPGAMQSHSDTTRFQTSEVANAQTAGLTSRVGALAAIRFHLSCNPVSFTDKIMPGAAFTVLHGDEECHYVVLPAGGGLEIEFEGKTWNITTPSAPLYKNAAGKKKDEIITVGEGKRRCSFKIMEVC